MCEKSDAPYCMNMGILDMYLTFLNFLGSGSSLENFQQAWDFGYDEMKALHWNLTSACNIGFTFRRTCDIEFVFFRSRIAIYDFLFAVEYIVVHVSHSLEMCTEEYVGLCAKPTTKARRYQIKGMYLTC